MASFSVSLNNSLNLFGIAPTDNWNAYNWNAFIWGEGTQGLETIVTKVLDSGSATFDSSLSLSLQAVATLDNDLTFTGDMYSESVSDGSGYNVVFAGNTTNGENRPGTTYTAGSAGSTTWTSATVGSTSWSEA